MTTHIAGLRRIDTTGSERGQPYGQRATPLSRIGARRNTRGSEGLTPKRKLARKRVRPRAAAIPQSISRGSLPWDGRVESPEELRSSPLSRAMALFPFRNPNHGRNPMLGGNRDAHVHMVPHKVTFNNLTLPLPSQRVEVCRPLSKRLAEDDFPSSLGHEHNMALAVPFSIGQAQISF